MAELKVCVGEFRVTSAEREALNRVLDSGRITEHAMTREFERAFAEYIGAEHSIAVNSGTSALIALLTALRHDPRFPKAERGAKVITSPLTYVATPNAIVLAGFEPVFVDITPDRFSIVPELVEQAIVEENPDSVAAVLPVHLMGYPCDMGPMGELAGRHDVAVIEDAAQAHGSIYEGKRAGALSLASAFSFYVAHNLQAGEMGAVVTDDAELDRRVRQIKANGRACACPVCTRRQGTCPRRSRSGARDDVDPRFDHAVVGYNFKVTEFQTAIALAQLARAEDIRRTRLRVFRALRSALEDLEPAIQLPEYDESVSYLAFPIVLRDSAGIDRKDLRLALEESGVETRPLFGCIPISQPSFRHLEGRYRGRLPNAERVGRLGFYVGCHQYMGEEDIALVSRAFHEVLKDV